MKTTDNTKYNELWIPGFSLDSNTNELEKLFENTKIGDKDVLKVYFSFQFIFRLLKVVFVACFAQTHMKALYLSKILLVP